MWVTRWKYEIAAKASRRGIWKLKAGGFLIRCRVTDPRSGRESQAMRILRGEALTIEDAQRALDSLRSNVRDRVTGKIQSRMLWSEFAVSRFEAKVIEQKLKSAKSRERWAGTLKHLLPAFGRFHVDELRFADIAEWRATVAIWLRDGMPSIRKGDEDKNRIVKLSPVTANGWIAILKEICSAMTKRFELPRDPAADVEFFREHRNYTREQPNALTPAQLSIFLAKMKELHPNHHAMTFLGFVTGLRPSSLRPLRRRGPEADVLWDEGVLLIRRSNSMGQEVMDETKTATDQEIPLPKEALRVLRRHAAKLPLGPMRDSDLLFPATNGGMRARSVLDKPFRNVLKALRWTLRLTPRGMRRTFQDVARTAQIHDVVTRAISGHATKSMQQHYSTAQRTEMRDALSKVVSVATSRRAVKGDAASQPPSARQLSVRRRDSKVATSVPFAPMLAAVSSRAR
jgi:hypothetical protein